MIERHLVDGVPAVLAPTTGPSGAGLAFRVGHADEPAARRGITRLIEHLVGNGDTGSEFTFFRVRGDESEIATFLHGVCASLRELPMDRLDLLRSEADGRTSAATEPLWRKRHGARDYGLAAYPEWGLPAITEDDLRDWVGRWFTRENAVLWVAGDRMPAGLRLDLPSGARHEPPAPSSALPVTPAYFPGGPDLIGWSAVAPRSAATSVFAAVLERMMSSELRTDQQPLGADAVLERMMSRELRTDQQPLGADAVLERMMSRELRTDQQPLGADAVLVSAIADALPGALIDLLATLRVGRVDEADLTAVVAQRIEALRRAEETADRLPEQAFRLLLGREVEDFEDAVARLSAVTVADVTEVAAAAWRTGLLMSPTPADWAGFTAAPTDSESAVPGTTYRSLEDENRRLIVGEDGVSIVDAENLATVRRADCVLLRGWPDGARHLLGADGISIRVEPALFANGPAAVAAIDALIDPDVRVDEPARDPEQIPQPRRKANPKSARARGPVWWREGARGWRRAHWRLRWSFAGAAIGAVGFTVVALQAAIESARSSDALFTLAVALLCIGVFGRAAWKRAGLLRSG